MSRGPPCLDQGNRVHERERATQSRRRHDLRVPIELVDDATTPDAVTAWDSVGQMELVAALEREFSTNLLSRTSC